MLAKLGYFLLTYCVGAIQPVIVKFRITRIRPFSLLAFSLYSEQVLSLSSNVNLWVEKREEHVGGV